MLNPNTTASKGAPFPSTLHCVSHSVVSDSLRPHGLSMGLSRQKYWSGLPFPSPGDLTDPEIELRSPGLQTDSLPSEPPGKPLLTRSDQIRSVAQSCPTLCDPMNRSMPGLPVHHQLPEFTQTHIHRVSDAIQPSHPLSSPFHPAPNPSQHQSLFQ